MQAVLPNLYISSWYHICRKNTLEDDGITHVLSVMTEVTECPRLGPFKRMIIEVNDHPDELLIDYFESATQWIDDSMAEGGKVVVHWYISRSKNLAEDSLVGRSRSATIVAAYLMKRFVIGVEEAIERIQQVRNIDPNPGFREQLQVYLDCNYVANTSKAAYRHWRLRQEAKLQKGNLHSTSTLLTHN